MAGELKFGRWTFFGWWTPQYQSRDALNTTIKNLADDPTLANGTPQELSIDALNNCIQNMADKHTLADGYLVVRNGNFTLLLTSSGQEWQFHIATDI